MAPPLEISQPTAFDSVMSNPLVTQIDFGQALDAMRSGRPPQTSDANAEYLQMTNPFPVTEGMLPSATTAEGKELRKALESPGALKFSTPVDNAASGKQPDYRMVEENGKLKLVKVGNGDPMEDGQLNIEIDAGNKSLMEAIQQADNNQKELIRELISYWQRNHPGEEVPAWMQAILNSQPFIPASQRTPTPIESNPSYPSPQVQQPPDAPSQPSWQGDYRSGGGTGYSPNYGGSAPSSPESYYSGGNNNQSWSVPSESPDFGNNPFIEKLTKTIMANEGAINSDGSPKFTAFNPDDNGGISVGLRQWHAGGALPELLNAWKAENPQKFEQYFKGYSPDQINNMSSAQFAQTPGLTEGMKEALADPQYQKVQTRLMEDWVKREVKTAMDMGLKGETEIAVFVDVANQYGQDTANRVAGLGKADGDQGAEMNQAARGGAYAERFALIDKNFSTNNASLEVKTPAPSEFSERLAKAVEHQDSQMAGSGYCATAVQLALKDVGLGQFVGSGDAWDMLGPLKRSGLFVEVPMSQAARGDIIVRPPSANPNDDSVYGDISVVTAKQGGRIQQTNDASYEFHADNARYDGRAVFLRYVGDQKNETASQKPKPENSSVAETETPEKEKKSKA